MKLSDLSRYLEERFGTKENRDKHFRAHVTKSGRPQATAEILYRYISGDDDFIESHTGLEDVMIEKEIFVHCMRQHKPMRKKCFA